MDLFGESLVDPDSDLEETEDEPPVSDVVDTRSESLVKPSSMTFCLGHGSQEQLLLD